MRPLLMLSLIILACAAPALCQAVSQKEMMGLKGPVKTVRTERASVAQGESKPAEGGAALESEITLDREGRVVEERRYNPDGALSRRSVFAYGADGSTESSYNADGTLHHRTLKREEFDKARGTSRMIVTGTVAGYEHGLYTEFLKKYDSQGRWVESSAYDRDGKLTSRSVNRFGADGALEEFLLYNGAGAVLQRYVRVPEGMRVMVYAEDGRLLSTETRRRPVCTQSDSYGNCQRQAATRSVSKDGKVEEITDLTYRSFTYY